MEILHLLEKLTQNCGVAGYEKPIADLLEDEIKDIGPVRRTPLGSLICTVKQKSPDKPHVVLEAHMDEIGLMVCDIDDRGFLKVTRCGGIDRRVATASPVIIHGKNGDRRGIVASEEQNPAKNPTLEQLYVDAGVSREQAEKEFPIGTRISYIGSFKHLLEGNVSSKALDDRCGCAAMITAARMLKEMDTDCSITLLLSVMEDLLRQQIWFQQAEPLPEGRVFAQMACDYYSVSPSRLQYRWNETTKNRPFWEPAPGWNRLAWAAGASRKAPFSSNLEK